MVKKLMVLLLSSMMLLSTIGCGNSGEEKNNETEKSTSKIVNSEENDKESSETKENGLTFWINKQNWNGLKGTYDGTLLTKKLKAPLKLSEIDELGRPYFWFLNGYEGQNAETLSEILESDEIQGSSNPTKIGVQSSFDETWVEFEGEKLGLVSIQVFNYAEEDLSIKECYEKNWWFAELNYEALGISPDVKSQDYQIERADAIVQLLGAPTYILDTFSSFESACKENEGSIYYCLVYDFDEYVIVFDMSENVFNEYNTQFLKIDEIKYYTKESWEKELIDKQEHAAKKVSITP